MAENAQGSATNKSLVSVKESMSEQLPSSKLSHFLRRYRWVIVVFFGLFFTAWWISIIAQNKTRHRWLIPTVLYILLMVRFVTFYVSPYPLFRRVQRVYNRTFIPARDSIPEYLWVPIEAIIMIATVLIATFATPQYNDNSKREDRAVSFFGFIMIYFFFFIACENKRAIKWHTVVMGMFLQYIIALFVLRTKAGYDFFNWISFLARQLLGFAHEGISFLLSDEWVTQHPFFMFTGLPSVVFFIALIQVGYYFGVLQWLVTKLAYVFFWLMQISGAEATSAAATPFVGQAESIIMVKPFLNYMTDAELFQVMVCGMATVSGSMLASYISLGLNANALVTSCVMSIPSAIAASKLVVPETESPLTADKIVIPEDTSAEEAHNWVHAFSNGAWLGLQIVLSMGTNILCIITAVSLINALLTWFGKFWGIPHLTLEQIVGYIFYPVSFLLGVSRNGDIYRVAKLMAIKTIQNEYVAFSIMQTDPEYQNLTERSRMLATYALCGFANFGSAGTIIGVLSSLCPDKKPQVAKMLIKSVVVGCFVTLSSAAVAGMVMADFHEF